jgi:hypothetical protein
MAEFRGDKLIVQWIHGAGTLAITSQYRTLAVEQMVDTIDASAGTASAKKYILGLDDVTMELGYVVQDAEGTATTVARRALAVKSYGTLTWGPEGSAVGLPKYSCPAWITTVSEESKYDGLQERSVSFQRNGAWITHFDGLGSTW